MNHRHWIPSGLVACVVCAILIPAESAAGPDSNVLRNTAFEKAPETGGYAGWAVDPIGGWTRGEIVSFRGKPWSLYYLERKGEGGRIVQRDITVEPQTWYVLHAWYRGTIRPGKSGQAHLYLYAASDTCQPERKARYGLEGRGSDLIQPADAILPPYGGVIQGSSAEWVPVRAFAYSGEHRTLVFTVGYEGGGDVVVGNCEMRRAGEDDFRDVNLLDGSFENGAAGYGPVAFIGKPGYGRPLVRTEPSGANFRLGNQQSAVVPRHAAEHVFLYGPQSVPVFPGQRVKITFWARSSYRRPGSDPTPMILTSYTLRQRDWWRTSQASELKFEWDRVIHEVTVPAAGKEQYVAGPQLLDFALETTGPALDLWLDDYTIEVLPPADAKPAEPRGWMPTRKNLIMNSSFEAGMQGWGLRFTGNNPTSGVTVMGMGAMDRGTPHDGGCSLRVELPNLSPTETRATLSSAFFPVEPDTEYTVSFWARADKPVTITISLHWHNVNMSGDKLDLTTEWRRFDRKFKVASVRSDYEKMLSLVFHAKESATYWFDAVQVEKGTQATEFEPSEKVEIGADCTRLYPYYLVGESPRANLYLASHLREAETFKVAMRFRDWKGRILARKTRDIQVPPNATIIEEVPLLGTAAGAIYFDLEATGQTTSAAAKSTMIYGMFHAQSPTLAAEDGYFGVHTFLIKTPLYDYSLPGGTMDEFFKQLRFLGFTWDRCFGMGDWAEVEPQQGVFKWQDAYVDSATKHGMRILVVLGPNLGRSHMPEWADSDIPLQVPWIKNSKFYPRLDHWCDFVRAIVEHYGGRIDAYEMLNETGWFSPEKYLEFTKATRQTIRAVNPKVRLAGPDDPSNVLPWDANDDSWIGKVFKMGVYDQLDVITGHFYPPSRGVKWLETFMSPRGSWEAMIDRRVNYLRSAYGDKPLWDTEYGFLCASQLPWMYYPRPDEEFEGPRKYSSPRIHAERFLRHSLLFMAAGTQRSFFHVLGHGSLTWQSHQTLVEANFAPKPILAALSQAARRLQPVHFRGKAAIGVSARLFLFDVHGQPVVVYWDFGMEGQEGSLIVAGIPDGAVLVEDLMGNPLEPRRGQGCLILPLGTDPVYVMSDRLSGEALLGALAAGRKEVPARP